MMTLPRTAAEVLADHVTLQVEAIDRIYCNVYQPRLQYDGGIVSFFKRHRGHRFASSALMKQVTDAFVANIGNWTAVNNVEVRRFKKGERKDDIAAEYLRAAASADGSVDEQILFVGVAQEKASVFRTGRRRNKETGTSYAYLYRDTAMVNFYYFYGWDSEVGPFFIKFCSYFPYNARLYCNGNEYAKVQASKSGIAFVAMDNAFASCADPSALQEICDSFDETVIDKLVAKWLDRLPYPFAEDDTDAGYTYDISVLQLECSLTQVLDRPLSGRILFEQLIVDNLDLGRPHKVSLIFGRRIHTGRKRRTMASCRTRLVSTDVIPSLHVDYKHCTIKQYFKEGKAIRTETTINDPTDFFLGKRLNNLPALRQVGFDANQRLLDVQRISHDPATGAEALAAVTSPVTTPTGTRVAGLRIDSPRTQALLAALCTFVLLPNGFTNREFRALLAALQCRPIEDITAGQTTYDLRRLRVHGLITRTPHTHRYTVTATGSRTANYLTRVIRRVLIGGLAITCDAGPPADATLRKAADAYHTAITQHLHAAGIAA